MRVALTVLVALALAPDVLVADGVSDMVLLWVAVAVLDEVAEALEDRDGSAVEEAEAVADTVA